MKIPKNTVSVTQLRTYGNAGLRTDEQEEDRGCARRYRAKYVDGVKEAGSSYPLIYGSMFHAVMERIVAHDADPEQAILEAIGRDATPEMVEELLVDLETYMARPPDATDDMAVLGTEVDLRVPLYEDPEHGEILLRAIIDWIGIDPDEPDVIHVKDYKSNRMPISTADLAGDIQLRAYAWIVLQVARRWTDSENPRVIVHMDLVKYRDYVYEYSAAQLEAWHMWAVALVRTMLRDEDAEPTVNAYCGSCPVKGDCPALAAAPEAAVELAAQRDTLPDLETGAVWRDRANKARLQLEKAVKAWDEEFESQVRAAGSLDVGASTYVEMPREVTHVDVFAIARMLGDDFAKVASVSKAAVTRSSLPASTKDAVLGCFTSEFDGTRIVKTKRSA